MSPVLPPEARLVAMVTRSRTAPHERELLATLREPLDWRLVGEMAEREKLLPVLWGRLGSHTGEIPPAIADRIHAQAAVTEFRLAMTEVTLARVADLLAAEGIEILLLKGAALATTVYPSFAARPMGDLDILVPPGQADRAWHLLVARGWREEFAGGDRFYEGHHHLKALLDPGGLHLVLEVHRTALPAAGPFRFDEAALWRDSSRVPLGNGEAAVPSSQHQLLHLCVHFAWSNMLFSGLGRTARDIATLLEDGGFDWDGFVVLARQSRATSSAYWALRLARTLARAPVPDETLRRLRPPGMPFPPAALERALIASALTRACPSVQVMRWLWCLAIRPGASGHGESRPWQVGEAYAEAFQVGPGMGRSARLRSHLRGWGAWARFLGILGLPRPVT